MLTVVPVVIVVGSSVGDGVMDGVGWGLLEGIRLITDVVSAITVDTVVTWAERDIVMVVIVTICEDTDVEATNDELGVGVMEKRDVKLDGVDVTLDGVDEKLDGVGVLVTVTDTSEEVGTRDVVISGISTLNVGVENVSSSDRVAEVNIVLDISIPSVVLST